MKSVAGAHTVMALLFIIICTITTSIIKFTKADADANYTLPTYTNCIKLGQDGNVFQWSISNNMFYGRVIGIGAEDGWTAIGFSSGYDYETVPNEPDADPPSKMNGATIYLGYKDVFDQFHMNEYFSSGESQPTVISKQYRKLSFSLARAYPNNGDFHMVFERSLTTTNNYPGYYQFVPGDKSNILFAKHPLYTPLDANDFEKHSVAQLRKINFFGSYNECGEVSMSLPPFRPVKTEEDIEGSDHPRYSGLSSSICLNTILLAFVLAVASTVIVYL